MARMKPWSRTYPRVSLTLEQAYGKHRLCAYQGGTYRDVTAVYYDLAFEQFKDLWGDKWPPEDSWNTYYIGRKQFVGQPKGHFFLLWKSAPITYYPRSLGFTLENAVLKKEQPASANSDREWYMKWDGYNKCFRWTRQSIGLVEAPYLSRLTKREFYDEEIDGYSHSQKISGEPIKIEQLPYLHETNALVSQFPDRFTLHKGVEEALRHMVSYKYLEKSGQFYVIRLQHAPLIVKIGSSKQIASRVKVLNKGLSSSAASDLRFTLSGCLIIQCKLNFEKILHGEMAAYRFDTGGDFDGKTEIFDLRKSPYSSVEMMVRKTYEKFYPHETVEWYGIPKDKDGLTGTPFKSGRQSEEEEYEDEE